MASGVRQLYIRLGMDTSGLRKGVSGANSTLRTMTKTVAVVGAAMLALGAKVSRMAMQYERTKLTFDAFTGSAEKSREMLRSLEKMAIKTPLESSDLNEAATQLLGFGLETEKILPTLKMLGDLARGDAQSFKQLAYVYGQARAETKAMSKDLRQFINAGVPVLKLLADSMGVAENSIFDLAEQGKISFGELEKAFEKATSEGGMYFNFMARQATTASGLFSTLSDAFSIYLRRVGEYLLPTLKEAADILIGAMDNMNDSMNDAAANDAPIRMAASFRAAFETIKVLATATSYVLQGMFEVVKQAAYAMTLGLGRLAETVGFVTKNSGLQKMGMGMSAEGIAGIDKTGKKIKELHMLGEILAAQNGSLGETYDRVWGEAYNRIKETEEALSNYSNTTNKTKEDILGLGGAWDEVAEKMRRKPLFNAGGFSTLTAMLPGTIKGRGPEDLNNPAQGNRPRTALPTPLAFGGIDRMAGKIAEVQPMLGKTIEQMQVITGFANSMGDAFVNAFDQIVAGGFKFGEFMKEMFMGIIKQAIKALVITAALKILSGGTASFGDIFKSVLGGGFLPKTASGGITNGPQTRIVGEAGREAIIPLNRGSSRNMLGGGGKSTIVGVIRGRDLHLLSVMGQQDALRRGSPVIQF